MYLAPLGLHNELPKKMHSIIMNGLSEPNTYLKLGYFRGKQIHLAIKPVSLEVSKSFTKITDRMPCKFWIKLRLAHDAIGTGEGLPDHPEDRLAEMSTSLDWKNADYRRRSLYLNLYFRGRDNIDTVIHALMDWVEEQTGANLQHRSGASNALKRVVLAKFDASVEAIIAKGDKKGWNKEFSSMPIASIQNDYTKETYVNVVKKPKNLTVLHGGKKLPSPA